MIVLGIETSCDECSAAVVKDGHEIMSNVIATQIELHKPYQGVVPELASRLHTEWIQQVVEASLRQAVYTAIDVFRNRQRYDEAYARPLRKQYHERRDDSDKLKLNAPEE